MSVGGSEPTWGIHIKLSPARLRAQILAFFSHMTEQQSQTLCLCCFQMFTVLKMPLHISNVRLTPAECFEIRSQPYLNCRYTYLIENLALTIMALRATECIDTKKYQLWCGKICKILYTFLKNRILIYFHDNLSKAWGLISVSLMDISTTYPFTPLSK